MEIKDMGHTNRFIRAPEASLTTMHSETKRKSKCKNPIRLLALLGRLGSLDLLGPTELKKCESLRGVDRNEIYTFFALFLRSFRSLRDALSTLVANPD